MLSKVPEMSVFDFDRSGAVLYPNGRLVPDAAVGDYLARTLKYEDDVTDIFVYAHGWQTSAKGAVRNAGRLFERMLDLHRRQPTLYPKMGSFNPRFVLIRWRSRSLPDFFGYRKIKRRAHSMSIDGKASELLASVLWAADEQRMSPQSNRDILITARGQYLHCLGHSFGGRLLVEAISRAARGHGQDTLGWARRSSHPFGVDSLVLFQLAAPDDAFTKELSSLMGDVPLHGPAVLTFSRYDRALSVWHRLAGDGLGVGAVGASVPADEVLQVRMRSPFEAYPQSDFAATLVNVDASFRFEARGVLHPIGSHSSFLVSESAHLVLTVAAYSRRD